MVTNVTLEQVEQLVARLSLQEQIQLIARISQRLSELTALKTVEEQWKQNYMAQVQEFLKLIAEMPAQTLDRVDAAEDIRQIREERTSRL